MELLVEEARKGGSESFLPEEVTVLASSTTGSPRSVVCATAGFSISISSFRVSSRQSSSSFPATSNIFLIAWYSWGLLSGRYGHSFIPNSLHLLNRVVLLTWSLSQTSLDGKWKSSTRFSKFIRPFFDLL